MTRDTEDTINGTSEDSAMNADHPTPQHVAALLQQAGFTESQTSPSGDPRLVTHTEGYVVGKWYTAGKVAVKHQIDTFSRIRGVAAQVREHETLNDYTQVLEAAGYEVQRDQVGFGEGLIVSTPPNSL